MQAHGGVCVNARQAHQAAWLEPIRDGMNKHVRFVWIKRGGNSKTSGSGASGCKATPRALLSRALRDRAGVAAVVTTRQAARVARKANPPKVIYGRL